LSDIELARDYSGLLRLLSNLSPPLARFGQVVADTNDHPLREAILLSPQVSISVRARGGGCSRRPPVRTIRARPTFPGAAAASGRRGDACQEAITTAWPAQRPAEAVHPGTATVAAFVMPGGVEAADAADAADATDAADAAGAGLVAATAAAGAGHVGADNRPPRSVRSTTRSQCLAMSWLRSDRISVPRR
jgi:hypothetical protein